MVRPAIYPGNVLGGSPLYDGLTLGGEVTDDPFVKADYPGLRAVRMGGEIILATDLADSVSPIGFGTPGGVLDYAQITSSQGSITTETDITGLSVTAIVAANRRIRISVWGRMSSTNTTTRYIVDIKEGSTYVGKAGDDMVNGDNSLVVGGPVLTPSAGSHTYIVRMRRISGTGTGSFVADAASPGYMLVEDIGSSVPVTELLY